MASKSEIASRGREKKAISLLLLLLLSFLSLTLFSLSFHEGLSLFLWKQPATTAEDYKFGFLFSSSSSSSSLEEGEIGVFLLGVHLLVCSCGCLLVCTSSRPFVNLLICGSECHDGSRNRVRALLIR